MSRLKKVKKANGQIIACNEVRQLSDCDEEHKALRQQKCAARALDYVKVFRKLATDGFEPAFSLCYVDLRRGFHHCQELWHLDPLPISHGLPQLLQGVPRDHDERRG